MIIILFLLTTCSFAAFAKPFSPISDAFASGDASDNLISANAVTLPAFSSNAGTIANPLGSPSRSFNFIDPSDSSTTPFNLFSSTISKINPNINFQDISIPQEVGSTNLPGARGPQELGSQDVSHSEDTSATTLESNVPASNLLLSILQSDSNTLIGPIDSNLGPAQVQTPESSSLSSDTNNPAESGDSDLSERIALEDGNVIPFIPQPIRSTLDGVSDWVGDWLQQSSETLQNWVGSFDQKIPDCVRGKFSFCCWKPAPTKYGNNKFYMDKLGDSRRDCWKLIDGMTCPFNNHFCCKCADKRQRRGWAYKCYSPWYFARNKKAPDPDPRPEQTLVVPGGETSPHDETRPDENQKAKREEVPKRRGPKKGDPRLTGRPSDPWTCSKEWLLEEYNIRDY